MIRAALILGITLAGLQAANPHSWYDHECCSDNDCHPYDGTVVEDNGGYRLQDGRFIAYSDSRVRVSPDNGFHLCEIGASIICLYAPGRTG